MMYFAKKWLTGDLYRTLSMEGDGLTQANVAEYLQQLRSASTNLGITVSEKGA